MARIVRSIYGYYSHLQNLSENKYKYNYETKPSTPATKPFLPPITKPLANYQINQKISMLPLHNNYLPKITQVQPETLEAKHFYHTSPKYGASPYTSSLVAGKMHKLVYLLEKGKTQN